MRVLPPSMRLRDAIFGLAPHGVVADPMGQKCSFRAPESTVVGRGCVLFVLVHKSLWITPAMAAGVSDKLWSLEELVERTTV
jgi:hypothetical protein